jgi:glycosyltransferase involved in cell wall biosynthesis
MSSALKPLVAVLTGGGDRPYALGFAGSLAEQGIPFDFIASDDLESEELRASDLVRFLNLRGDSNPRAPIVRKIARVVVYYVRLLAYVTTTPAEVIHILWNSKLEYLDRTILMLYYRLLGKRVVLTVHNVNVGKRDSNDSLVKRLTLGLQYRLVDHLFVHTDLMKTQLSNEFGVGADRISVIPFGINDTVPITALSRTEARRRLGLAESAKVVLFFGNIAPYKGVEFLVEAFVSVIKSLPECRLVIAGRPKGAEAYWHAINSKIVARGIASKVLRHIEYIADADTEVFFKAADVLALPYLHVFQSGVLFLAYNFGLPVIATDVGALGDDVVEGVTGLVCKPRDVDSLAREIGRFFESELYSSLEARRPEIRRIAEEGHSWRTVARLTAGVYRSLQSVVSEHPAEIP